MLKLKRVKRNTIVKRHRRENLDSYYRSNDRPHWYYEIQASSQLYVSVRSDGDPEHFACVFRDTWKRVPLYARRAMVAYWRKGQGKASWNPSIRLANGWPGWKRRGYGDCSREGHQLRFFAPTAEIMPNPVLSIVIAHELAHVYQLAEGTEGGNWEEEDQLDIDDPLTEDVALKFLATHTKTPPEQVKADLQAKGVDAVKYVSRLFSYSEAEVDETLLNWGFDVDALTQWETEHDEELTRIFKRYSLGEPT